MSIEQQVSHSNIKLNSVEIASIWNGYQIETIAHYMYTSFLSNIEDPDVKSITTLSKDITKKHIENYIDIFNKENFAIPRGMTDEDITLDAPRLYSDIFYINYIKIMIKFAMSAYTISFTGVIREDIKQLFKNQLENLVNVELKISEVMVSKGIYNRPPTIPYPEQVDFVKKPSFLKGIIGDKRSLTVNEIIQLFSNAELNGLGKATIMGFSQVARDMEVKKFLLRGKEISHKFIHIFNDLLIEEDITPAKTFDNEVTSSTATPYSDRLMLLHTAFLISFGITNFAAAIVASQRSDLAATYSRLITEIAAYAEDAANLLIKKGWLEQPPMAINRDALVK